MTLRRKSDNRRITRFLADLKKADWLGTARRWWPDYVFHFTDIENAVSVLRHGILFSRVEAQRRGLMDTDNASQEVIGNTDEMWKDYVRLYFRPRTPTQYRNEGFRPVEQRWQDAHCPVPIYFLFDSKAVLSRSDSQFTDGNLASSPQIFSEAADLESIPFESVYHDGRFEPHERDSIVFHRHAEVVVPKQVGLEALKYIVCRSQAEYETLLHLLPQSVLGRWERKIGIDNQTRLFFKRWIHVRSVDLSSQSTNFHFSTTSETPEPFHAKVSITDTASGRSFSWEEKLFTATKSLILELSDIGPLWDYSVQLSLSGKIAYANRYQEDLPW